MRTLPINVNIEEDSLVAVDDLSINFESSSPTFKLIFWHSNCSAHGLEGR